MNTLTLQKQVKLIEKVIRKASRILLEFEVAQSQWDIKNGRYKVYDSAEKIIPDIKKRLR
jgi:hypothetical protein